MQKTKTGNPFCCAKPVWEAGTTRKMNYEISLKTVIGKWNNVSIKIATSGTYRLWINGEFVAYGPAKGARGFFKVDRILMEKWLDREQNVIVLDVCGHNVNSFYVLDQPSFVMAEVISNEECLAWTGENGNFIAYRNESRVQKVQRYSYQRTLAEVYRYEEIQKDFYISEKSLRQACVTEIVESGHLLYRDMRYPVYDYSGIREIIREGKVNFHQGCENPYQDRAYKDIGPQLKGFRPEELEEPLSNEIQDFGYLEPKTEREKTGDVVIQNGYILAEMPLNMTGFVKTEITCEEDCTVYVLFDEILIDDDINPVRMSATNCIKYYLGKGTYHLQSFEPYTMKYMKIIVKGKAKFLSGGIVQYRHEEPKYQVNLPDDEDIRKIYQAALETYRVNTVDNFFDCPSRERAGWLCDSFFTARVEKVLTGENILEKAFLRNFITAESFPNLPEGMLPMCYPADFYNGSFIPNWAMWFVIELEEYFERTGDLKMVEDAKDKVYRLLNYFDRFRNKHCLLERLEGWLVIEWSEARKWQQDVNFPVNMLYAKMLESVGRLYHDGSMTELAAKVKESIIERSFNGKFFTDHELISGDSYINPGDCSEVCQYYAFFTGTATKETFPELWKCLLEELGPKRFETKLYPEVAYANMFIGYYLRLELLYLEHRYEEILEDMKLYFLPMVNRTGTLWEFREDNHSCCHGFASHVIYWLAGMYGIVERK